MLPHERGQAGKLSTIEGAAIGECDGPALTCWVNLDVGYGRGGLGGHNRVPFILIDSFKSHIKHCW